MMFLNATKGQVLRYALLPEAVPRIKSFITSGFGNLAYFMALVYRAVNLLPNNHSYLKTQSIGKFTIRDVLSTAAGNLVFSTKHIDQIIIFFALIAGIVILGLQFLLLLISFIINPASAQEMPSNYAEFFTTQNPSEDLALRLLDMVFGVNNMFGSKEDTETAFHTALHTLFQFYSTGLLVIAVMIVIYFIFAILAETAQTGTPFGKRFNHVWAPLRLVAAIGLLIPIGSGLNSGQWITLHAAKFGSAFATNGWIKFNETIGENFIPAKELVARTNITNLQDIAGFMMIAHACKEAYIIETFDDGMGEKIDAYVIDPDSAKNATPLSATGYLAAVKLSKFDTIKVRIGHFDPTYTDDKSKISPSCGEITLTIPANPIKTVGVDEDVGLKGAGFLNARYYIMLQKMWNKEGAYGEMEQAAALMMYGRLTHAKLDDPSPDIKTKVEEQAQKFIYEGMEQAVSDLQKEFNKDGEIIKFGWAGAGIWYNKIAEVNGILTGEALNKPIVRVFPKPMEMVCEEKRQQNANTDPKTCYTPRLANNKDVPFTKAYEKDIAAALSDVYNFWNLSTVSKTKNTFIDVVNKLIGTQGLFDMCKNANIHPLAQLSSVGKGLIEAAIRNLGYAGILGIAGIVPIVGPAASAASSFAVTIAGIGILIGFILFYILPFLPFLYFLFAVGGWVKGLFEAMVGVPLWALAHIRIDGEGLPGEAAINGYFLIFEIFIRPILIIFGLLASIIIFGAMIKVLNEIFSLVVSNLSGFDTSRAGTCGESGTGRAPTGSLEYFRGPVDQFFFTIVYAILVYMIAMSTFKLIDLIPNNILRWMGAGVSTFNDQAGEPAEGLLTKMAVGGSLMGSRLQTAGSSLGSALGSASKAVISK